MGSILLQAFCSQNVAKPENIVATVNHAERVDSLAAKYGVRVTTDNRSAVKDVDVILLCVKPQTLGEVVDGQFQKYSVETGEYLSLIHI